MNRRPSVWLAISLTSILLAALPAGAAQCLGTNGGPGDIDGDGFVAAADCDDGDAGVWALPGEVPNLRPTDRKWVFAWDSVADESTISGAVQLAYDVLRSSSPSNFLTGPDVACIDPSGLDLEASDLAVPAPGQAFFYLVRARSQCGPGNLGASSDGVARAGKNCDCAVLCDDGNACTKDVCSNGACAHEPIPPIFVASPASTATCAGRLGRFATEVASSSTAHYAWRKNGAPVGSDSPILDLPAVSPTDNGAQITVQLTDGCSSATSAPAVLTVFSDAASCAGGLNGQEAPNGASQLEDRLLMVDRSGSARVLLHSGDLQYESTDLAVAGRGFDFVWTRTYRSREVRSSAVGMGWTHSYERGIAPDPANPANLLVRAGDSRTDSFAPNALGCFGAPGFFEELCPQPDGTHVLTFPDGTTWSFSPLDGSAAQGRIVQARDAYGNAMGFAYDGSGRLSTITDTLDRTVQLAYNARSLVESVTDFTGRSVRYSYYDGIESGGAIDDLKSVTSPPVTGTPTGNDFPQGKKTAYTYSNDFLVGELNHNLTSITDGLGQTVARFAYSLTDNRVDPAFDRLYRVELPDTASTAVETYAYVSQTPSAGNGFAVSTTVVKDPEGNVGEYSYDALSRLVRVRDFTGRAPDVSGFTGDVDNRPAGQLRATDPPYFETQFEYNADFLPTRIVEPNGDSLVKLYDKASPVLAKRGDLLHETRIPGPLGGDQPQLDRAWVHGTPFGTDWGGRGDTAARLRDKIRGWDGTIHGLPREAATRGKVKNIKTDPSAMSTGPGRPDDGIEDEGDSPLGAFKVKHKGWDGLIYGNHRAATAGRTRHKGWDGLIYGSHRAAAAGRTRHKGWDGLIYGNHRAAAAGRTRHKGWDGLIYGNHRAAPATHPTSFTDENGNVWTFSYDPQGSLTGETAPLVVTGTLSGAPQTIHHAWSYNAFGQPIQSTDPEGRVDRFEYYAAGPQRGYLHRAIIDQPGLALTTTYEYDALGRATRVTDPKGQATTLALDSAGNVVRLTESAPLVYQTDFYYDANDRLVRTDLPNVDEFGTVRPNPRLSESEDIDRQGRVVRVRSEVDGAQCVIDEYAWTPNGQLALWRKGAAVAGTQPSNVVSASYDERMWCFRVRVSDNATAPSTTQYDYDGNGNLAAERRGARRFRRGAERHHLAVRRLRSACPHDGRRGEPDHGPARRQRQPGLVARRRGAGRRRVGSERPACRSVFRLRRGRPPRAYRRRPLRRFERDTDRRWTVHAPDLPRRRLARRAECGRQRPRHRLRLRLGRPPGALDGRSREQRRDDLRR